MNVSHPPMTTGTKVRFDYNGPLPTDINPQIVARSGQDCEISGIVNEGDPTISPAERADAGCGYVYRIKFPDGFGVQAHRDNLRFSAPGGKDAGHCPEAIRIHFKSLHKTIVVDKGTC